MVGVVFLANVLAKVLPNKVSEWVQLGIHKEVLLTANCLTNTDKKEYMKNTQLNKTL